MLEHHHPVRAGVGVLVHRGQGLAVQEYLPGGEAVEAGDGVEQGGFAAAAGAHDGHELSRADLQRAVIKGHHVDPFRVVDLAHVTDGHGPFAGPANRGQGRGGRFRRIDVFLFHASFSPAYEPKSSRSRQAMSLRPTLRTAALDTQPMTPRVAMPMTITGYWISE